MLENRPPLACRFRILVLFNMDLRAAGRAIIRLLRSDVGLSHLEFRGYSLIKERRGAKIETLTFYILFFVFEDEREEKCLSFTHYRCTLGSPQVYHYTPLRTALEVIMTELLQAWRVSVSLGQALVRVPI